MARILVVDDEESIRNLMRMTLELDGYKVSTAADGPTALEIFEKENPEVVLLDVRLPGMSGIEILDRIKAINQDAEVIIITGHGDMDMAVDCLRKQASNFLNKARGRGTPFPLFEEFPGEGRPQEENPAVYP